MIYAVILMMAGYHMLTSANGSRVWAMIGFILCAIGMVAGNAIEDRYDDKTKSLEKELKEMKTNDQRNSL